MNKKFVDNIKQQTKRLLDQLNELEELRAEISEQEYKQMKKDTLEELQTFQKSVSDMQSGQFSLDSDIEKSKAELINAIKKNLNTDEARKTFLTVEIANVRNRIAQIENSFQMKKLSEADFVTRKVAEILKIKELSGELTEAEKTFIDVKGQFKEDKLEKMASKKENEYLDAAQKEIKKNLD